VPSTAFAARAQRFRALVPGLWSGLSLRPPPDNSGLRRCPSSLYTFPDGSSVRAWLGIAIAGSPEFGQFCIAGFPSSTQVCLKSVASAIPPRPRGNLRLSIIKQRSRIYTSVSVASETVKELCKVMRGRNYGNKLLYISKLLDFSDVLCTILSPLRLPVPPPPHAGAKPLAGLYSH
jgi:hypothetical protein